MNFDKLETKLAIVAGALFLLLAFTIWGWYSTWQSKGIIEQTLQHNISAWADSMRRSGDYYTRLLKEYSLADSLKSAKLSKQETKIAAIISENVRLRDLVGSVKVETVTVVTSLPDGTIRDKRIFSDTLANGLVRLMDSIAATVKIIDSTTSHWTWTNRLSVQFLRNIQLKTYLAQNAIGQWSVYVKPTNPMDTSFVSFDNLDGYVDINALKRRTFSEETFIYPSLGYDYLAKNLMVGVYLFNERLHMGIGFSTGAGSRIIHLGYFESLHGLFY